MATTTVGKYLLAAALVLGAPAAWATGFGERLDRADALRTRDPRQFDRVLDGLERDRASATEPERLRLRLLLDYRRLLRGDYQGALGDAVALYHQANDPTLKYRSALLIANTAAATREFLLGLRYLERALQMQQRVPDPALRHTGLIVAGTLYNQYGQFELGREYARQALAQHLAPRERCFAGSILIEAQHGLGLPLDAKDIESSISRCIEVRETIASNMIRTTLAQSWAGEGKQQQAIALLEAQLGEVEATAYPWLIGTIHGQLAKYRMDLGDQARAEPHARAAVRFAGSGQAASVINARQVLYQLALARRDFATALGEYRLYAEADKARLDDVKAREYAFQLTRHEIAQKNQSIALLSNQNQLLRLQQEVAQKAAWNSRLLIALLAVMALSLGYWGWRGRRMHRTLRQLAQTDSLTGLSNRRHFRAQSEAALAAGAQRGRPVSLLLFDLDHFKQINDQCGHAAGDWVLREVARVGRLQCREGDIFGRIGGEEFALTLVDCDLEDAEYVAEQCRHAIASIDAREGGCTLPVSASIGCVGTSVSGYDYEVLVAHADAAMYHSKVGGRNRVSLHPPALAQAGAVARPGREAVNAV